MAVEGSISIREIGPNFRCIDGDKIVFTVVIKVTGTGMRCAEVIFCNDGSPRYCGYCAVAAFLPSEFPRWLRVGCISRETVTCAIAFTDSLQSASAGCAARLIFQPIIAN